MANIERGFIYGFNCCLEGRGVSQKIDGNYENLDGENIGKKSWHPFLIISHTTKNNGEFTKYISAIPLTSSKSSFNQENGISLTSEMLSSGGVMLMENKSIIRKDKIISLHKNHMNSSSILGVISPDSISYKKIISEVSKNFGCREII